ncbi:MAG: flagellar biosynthesis protein FlgB [Gammaproteobacteria bacterium]|nr:MAG: flagellar biosynthesis protein FlgB [Gammaproteobacteria bacterium]
MATIAPGSVSAPCSKRATIIVFAKAPEAGKVKTRLTPKLSPTEAAELHERLALRTLEMVSQAAVANVELWCAPENSHPFFQHCRETYSLTLHKQVGDDLGQRMHHAFTSALTRSDRCLIIGTDCPQLTPQHLSDTLGLLDKKWDCVITPAADGGYVMLGLSKVEAELFRDIRWGSEHVFNETVARLKTLQWQWQQQTALHDIDRPSDLPLLNGINLPAARSL